jgi:hypothetical protein
MPELLPHLLQPGPASQGGLMYDGRLGIQAEGFQAVGCCRLQARFCRSSPPFHRVIGNGSNLTRLSASMRSSAFTPKPTTNPTQPTGVNPTNNTPAVSAIKPILAVAQLSQWGPPHRTGRVGSFGGQSSSFCRGRSAQCIHGRQFAT